MLFNLSDRRVGFDARDGNRASIILENDQREAMLSRRNTFRIDGQLYLQ